MDRFEVKHDERARDKAANRQDDPDQNNTNSAEAASGETSSVIRPDSQTDKLPGAAPMNWFLGSVPIPSAEGGKNPAPNRPLDIRWRTSFMIILSVL
jgi:hypothetical protein